MLIGYARVSTSDQTLNLQKDALEKAGCSRIFTDTASGSKSERIGLDQAISYVRKGDTLVVWRLDRLGRSLKHLIETITSLDNRKIGFKSITEAIDTTTSGGKLIFPRRVRAGYHQRAHPGRTQRGPGPRTKRRPAESSNRTQG